MHDMTHQLCREDGVQSTALRPSATDGKAALRQRPLLPPKPRADACITDKAWVNAPDFQLTQVSTGMALCADFRSRSTSCGSASCEWQLRAVIGLPDQCHLIANGQFLDSHGK